MNTMKKTAGASTKRAEIKQRRDLALEHARKIAPTANAAQLREASDAVVKEQKALIAHITEGALPCPGCNKMPNGMEQPAGRSVTFEIGCLSCKPFTHTDGTKREFRVRGGLLPRHTVDAWNEGPDEWMLYVDKSTTVPTVQAALPPLEDVPPLEES